MGSAWTISTSSTPRAKGIAGTQYAGGVGDFGRGTHDRPHARRQPFPSSEHLRKCGQGKWPKKEYGAGIELYKKTLGIIGLGNIGKEVARRALGFGMHVLAYDPPFTPMDFIVEITTKEQAPGRTRTLSRSTCRSTQEVRTDRRAKEFAMMKKGVVIVNCARGGVVDQEALLDALNSGKVAAAALDVFEHEPPTEAETALINHPHVSVSPHIGGSTVEAQERVGAEIAIKVVKALSPSH